MSSEPQDGSRKGSDAGERGARTQAGRRPICELPWNVYTRDERHGRCGAYVIAEFPMQIGAVPIHLPMGLNVVAGEPRAADAGIYPPAVDRDGTGGGVPIEELEAAFRLMAAAPDLLQACKKAEFLAVLGVGGVSATEHTKANADRCINEAREIQKQLRAAIAKAEGGAA